MRWFYTAATAIITLAIAADLWAAPNYRLLGDIALIVVTVLVAIFTVLYWARSKWWANRIGRVYLSKSVMLALVLAQGCLAVWWAADYPGREHVRFAIYALGAIVYVPMIVTLWREQQRDRKTLKEPR